MEISGPSWIDRNELHLPTGQKNAPSFTLPDGRIHATINRRLDQASSDIVGRAGIIGVMDAGLEGDKRFEWTHSNIFANAGKPLGTSYGAQNLTQQDVYNIADTIPVSVLYGNEIGEGTWGMPFTADQKRWFYERLKHNYDVANPSKPYPYRNIGTYGGFENTNGDPWLYATDGNTNVLPNSDSAPFKARLQTVAGARAAAPYFSLFESLGVGACVKNYADTADYLPDFYRKMYAALSMGRGMGKVGGLGPGFLTYLDWPNIEQLGGSHLLHNGIYYTRTKPDGTVLTEEHHPTVPYDYLVACNFLIGMCLTDGCTPFNERIKYSSNPADNNYPMEAHSLMDSTFEAAYRYAQTSRTAGRPWKFARYRFDGSETWIEPKTDFTDILDHASAFGGPYAKGNTRRGRPVVLYRDNAQGTALDFAVFDASRGKMYSETLVIEPVPGKTFSVTVRGATLRQFSETV